MKSTSPEAYRAPSDLSTPYWIARIVQTRTVEVEVQS